MSEILNKLLLQLVLILLNAFFAATEIAMLSLNEKKLKVKADEGNKKAGKMIKILEEPTRFLSTIQVGITLAGFLGSAFAADNFAEKLSGFIVKTFDVSEEYIGTINTVSVIVITIILSFFTLVFGELVPKRVAMKHKEKFAEIVCGIISALSVVLKPIIWFLTVSTNAVLFLCGINPNDNEEPVSEEDIVIMLDAGADEGSLKKNDVDYIKNIFKLNNTEAVDIMTPRKNVVMISESASIEEIINLIEEEGYSRIPVYSGTIDNVIGLLYARDFLLNYNKPDFKLNYILVEPVFVPESMHLNKLFNEMQNHHNHIAVVVNEYGVPSGIVTMEDILEELVGEIWDESDEEIKYISKNEDGSYNVLCNMSLEEFFEYFDMDSDDETESNTVNGWVSEKCGDIPEIGFTFIYNNATIEVIEADELMSHKIKITK